MEFSDWINQKFVDWRGKEIGHEKSVSNYAKLIGVNRSTLTQWMQKGGRKPEKADQIQILINFFGYEVYDALGLPRPAGEVTLDQLDPVDAAALSAAQAELAGVDPSTSEGLERIIKVFSDHGIKLIRIISPEGSINK